MANENKITEYFITDGQFSDKPICGQSSRRLLYSGLVNSTKRSIKN